ncbi:MAG: AAA family ATPase [Fibrobacteraceae bacterium]|nr:AAA family ATPase [Fibrobacteraceae bacterium]
MLGNLIEKINQTKSQSLQIIRNLPVIELSDDDCRNFEAFIRRTLNVKSICGSYSFQVETSPDHWAVCSNQYLALAAVAYDLALCLKKYFDFFDLKIRSNERESKLVIKLQNEFKNSAIQDIPKINDWLTTNNSMAYISHCKENEEDKDSLCYFLAGIDSKKFGNEKGVLRGTLDLFGAYILSTEPVTTAASGFLGSLVFALAQEPSFYERISNVFKESSQRHLCRMDDKDHLSLVSPLSSISPPSQIIYYGVPGCGKSNKIREQLKNVPEKNKVRVVFHPEYTNAEFIGQILPVTNDGIRYEFTPGPFTQIIKRAYLNPNEHFYLVIEEINRGNAAAIFGDTFQLLDRLKAGETDSLGNAPVNAAVNTFTEGWSQYFVQNDDINAYVRKATKQDDGSYQERNDGESIEEIKIKEIHFNANTAIRLPPNLSILATMNTSDQNVFTLDNAFQRRFDMELVRNEFDLDKPSVNVQYNAKIADTNIKWGQFWEWINAKITATLKGLSSTEDKRLGVWFVSNVGGVINEKVFAEKVLKYLWDDVFKFKRSKVFVEEIDTLEKLIAAFEKPEQGKSRFAVFKNFPEFSSSGAERSQNEGAANS